MDIGSSIRNAVRLALPQNMTVPVRPKGATHGANRGGGSMRIALALAVAALALLAIPAGPARAGSDSKAATIHRDTFTSQFTDTAVDDCRGIAGTIVGASVFRGQAVETSQGFHVHGTITDSGRIDWIDGTYTLIASVDRFAHNITTGSDEFTIAHVDSGDTYTSDGTFLYRYTHHEVVHVTVTQGAIDRVDFEKGRFHFFGDC